MPWSIPDLLSSSPSSCNVLQQIEQIRFGRVHCSPRGVQPGPLFRNTEQQPHDASTVLLLEPMALRCCGRVVSLVVVFMEGFIYRTFFPFAKPRGFFCLIRLLWSMCLQSSDDIHSALSDGRNI